MQKTIPEDAILIPEVAELVFQGDLFGVYQWPQQLYDGSSATFEMLKRADTASVICVVDDRVIVLNEEQPNSGARRNFPGGRIDPDDESVLAAAQREVLEETGYQFANWRLVFVKQPVRKMEWFVHYVLAWGVTGQQAVAHDPGEKIALELIDFASLRAEFTAHAGYLHDAHDLLDACDSLEGLLAVQEFAGKLVDR